MFLIKQSVPKKLTILNRIYIEMVVKSILYFKVRHNLSIISPCVYVHYELISLTTCALKRITQTEVKIINSYLYILVVENLY